MLDLDLSKVEESGGDIAPGEYVVTVKKAEVKDTKAGDGQYINVMFVAKGGGAIFHMFNIKNKNEKATQIGLGQLKTFLKVSGLDPTRLSDVSTLEGASCVVRVALQKDQEGNERPRITSFKENKEAKAEKEANPFS